MGSGEKAAHDRSGSGARCHEGWRKGHIEMALTVVAEGRPARCGEAEEPRVALTVVAEGRPARCSEAEEPRVALTVVAEGRPARCGEAAFGCRRGLVLAPLAARWQG